MKKAILALSSAVILSLLTLFCFSDNGYTDSGLLSVPKLTQSQIIKLLNDNPTDMPADGQLFEVEPSIKAPYSPGKVKDKLLQRTVDRLNVLRAVAGLPDVQLDAELCENAQYGAVLLAASNFSHYPSKPDDMDDDFYEKGYSATSSSNIAGGVSLLSTPECFMDDSDSNNIDRLGHRRWQLNPFMGKIGFGYALGGTYRKCAVEKVFDKSGEGGDYQFISWPSSGNFPTDLFDCDTVWSVSFNQRHFSYSNDNITVTLKYLSTGKTWTFSGQSADGFFNIDKEGYGVANCIIFRPDGIEKYSGEYEVTVSGLTPVDGDDGTVRFKVNFFCSHDLAYTAAKPASCPEKGNIEYWHCKKCGKYFSDKDAENEITEDQIAVNALGHDFTVTVTDPTCTGKGYTTYVCARCGYTYTSDEKPANGHNYTQSWSTDGSRHWKECTVCHAKKDQGPHTGGEATCLKAGVCAVCGTTYGSPDPNNHKHTEVRNSKTATVLEQGYSGDTYCTDCGSLVARGTVIPVLTVFTDVPDGAWFSYPVMWCYERGYISGTSATAFSPDAQLTRAMFVQILAKVAGADLGGYGYTGTFIDVPDGKWYTKAVEWAKAENITGGTSVNTFSPVDHVTREQLATFFFAYAKKCGYDTTASADIGGYSDATSVSGWAVGAVRWAVAEKLISGTSATTLSPKSYATRAQAAVIFRSFIENYAAKQGE